MNTTECELMLQRWNVIQHERLPELRDPVGTLMAKLEKVVPMLEWVRIEEFTAASWCGFGRPPPERAWLANAFVAKSVLGLTTTAALIERLTMDRARANGVAPGVGRSVFRPSPRRSIANASTR